MHLTIQSHQAAQKLPEKLIQSIYGVGYKIISVNSKDKN